MLLALGNKGAVSGKNETVAQVPVNKISSNEAWGIYILGALRLVLHSDGYESNSSSSVNASLANLVAVGLDNIGLTF